MKEATCLQMKPRLVKGSVSGRQEEGINLIGGRNITKDSGKANSALQALLVY